MNYLKNWKDKLESHGFMNPRLFADKYYGIHRIDFKAGIDIPKFCHTSWGDGRYNKITVSAYDMFSLETIGNVKICDFIEAKIIPADQIDSPHNISNKVVFDGLWVGDKNSPYPEFTELALYIESLLNIVKTRLLREITYQINRIHDIGLYVKIKGDGEIVEAKPA